MADPTDLATLQAENARLRAQVAALTPPTWRLLYDLTYELLVVSEANSREHNVVKGKRAKRQREATDLALWSQIGRLEGPKLLAREGRLLVCFTRLAFGRLDDDNLKGAFKAPRDSVAAWLGCDDGSRGPVTWQTEQEPHKRYRLRPAVRLQIFGVESEAGGQMRIGGG